MEKQPTRTLWLMAKNYQWRQLLWIRSSLGRITRSHRTTCWIKVISWRPTWTYLPQEWTVRKCTRKFWTIWTVSALAVALCSYSDTLSNLIRSSSSKLSSCEHQMTQRVRIICLSSISKTKCCHWMLIIWSVRSIRISRFRMMTIWLRVATSQLLRNPKRKKKTKLSKNCSGSSNNLKKTGWGWRRSIEISLHHWEKMKGKR